MILRILLTLIAAFFFLYLFWKKLKEDYIQNQIFTTGFYCLFGISIFSILTHYFYPTWTFWSSLLGSFFGLLLGIRRFHLKLFEAIEAWVLGSLSILLIFYFYLLSNNFSLNNLINFLLHTFLIYLFIFLDKNYKKFTWYKSGKVGFTGLSSLGLYFLFRAVIAIAFPGMLFFVGKIDVIISGVLAFGAFLFLFNLSKE